MTSPKQETYTEGDKVTFTFDGKDYEYRVATSHLVCFGGLDNREILNLFFDKERDQIYSFLKGIYGYECDGGDWPTYKSRDYAAATRVIHALIDMCNCREGRSPPGSQWRPWAATDTHKYVFFPPSSASPVSIDVGPFYRKPPKLDIHN